MKYFYDSVTEGFYIEGIHIIPESAIEITETNYQALLEGQSAGQQIVISGEGLPELASVQPSPYHQWLNGQWHISAEAQATLDIEQVEQFKKRLIHQIAEKTDRLKSAVLVGYPQAEIDSFYRQESEARAWVVNNNAATPMLSAIAENRGVSLAILAQKVIEKADLVSTVIGHIIGTRQGFEDRILTAKNLEELTACEQEIEQWQLPNP